MELLSKELLSKEEHPFFFIELSIYVPGRLALHSLYIKKASEVSRRSQELLSEPILAAAYRPVRSTVLRFGTAKP